MVPKIRVIGTVVFFIGAAVWFLNQMQGRDLSAHPVSEGHSPPLEANETEVLVVLDGKERDDASLDEGGQLLTTVVVTTPGGEPISGATVRVECDAHGVVSKVTEEAGLTSFARAEGCCSRVVHGAAPGYVAKSAQVGSTDTVRLVLDPGCELTGVVRLFGGRPSLGPVTVVATSAIGAHPSRRPVGFEAIAGSCDSTTQANSDGEFRLSGLDPRLTYAISAAGVLQSGESDQVRACGSGEIQLTMMPCWGTTVELVDSAGRALPHHVMESARIRVSHSRTIELLDTSAVASRLYGANSATEDEGTMTYYFRQVESSHGADIQSVEATFSLLGFPDTESTELKLGQLTDRGFPVTRISVGQGPSGWGDLRVVADEKTIATHPAWTPNGTLHLVSEEDETSLEVALLSQSGDSSGTTVRVPAGTYAVSLLSYPGSQECRLVPNASVVVAANQEVEIKASFDEDASFLFLGAARPGANLVEGAVFLLTKLVGETGRYSKWQLPAYSQGDSVLVGPLEPGMYAVGVVSPFVAPEGRRRVVLEGGATQSEWFVLAQ